MRQTQKVLTDDPIVIRIMELLKYQHLTEKDLTEYLGLANGVFTAWKYEGGKSYLKYMDTISEYLGVTNEYLLMGQDGIKREELTGEEIRMIRLYRGMDTKKKSMLKSLIENMAKLQKLEKQQENLLS